MSDESTSKPEIMSFPELLSRTTRRAANCAAVAETLLDPAEGLIVRLIITRNSIMQTDCRVAPPSPANSERIPKLRPSSGL
jgi:hypothetical protein